MTTVGDFLLQHQLHQFFGRRGHILKALPEGNHRKAHALQVLHHLYSAPAVKGDFPDIEPLAQLFDEFLDVAVMNHISLGSHQRSLAFPQVIGDMVAPDAEVEGFFRYPEVWQDVVFILLIQRREHQHESRNIRGGGQIQTAVADAPFQVVLGNWECTGVPLIHRHPADRLLYPLVEPKLPESILLTRILLGRFTSRFDLVDTYRDAEGRVSLFPHLGVCPVLILGSTVNDRIESRIDLPAFCDINGFLVYLVADGVGVVACCGDQEIQRLHPGITRALEHDIKEFPIGLGVQFIEDHTVGIEAVLIRHIR